MCNDEEFLKALNSNITKKPVGDTGGKVILRTFMQKIVFKVYPNGNIFIDQSQSKHWFTDSKEYMKKKVKAKAKPIKKAVIKQEESY